MKKTLITALLLGLSLTVGAEEKSLFTINGTAVSQPMLQHLAQDVLKPGIKMDAKIQQLLVGELVNRVLLSQAAVAGKLDQEAFHKAGLEMARISYLANQILQEQMASFKASDDAVKALYDKEHSKPTPEFKARHILHKEEKQAVASIAELKKGADFAELAKKSSVGPSGPQGGDLGWFSSDRMVKPFSDAVAGMKAGAFSETPVKTQFGWHVILLEETRELPAKPLEAVKPQLVAQLRKQALRDFVEQLRSKADIKSTTP